MKRTLILLAASTALCPACKQTDELFHYDLTEQGKVYDMCYMPAGHGSSEGYQFGEHGGFTISSVDIPARYAVVFQCKHGKFVIDGNRAEALYNKLEKSQDVTISYQEEHWRHWENGTTNDEVRSLHFLDANPTPHMGRLENP